MTDCELCGEGNRAGVDGWMEYTATIDTALLDAGYYHGACLKAALKAAFELADVPKATGEEK